MAENFDPNIPGQFQGDVTGLRVIDPAAEFVGERGNLVVDPGRAFQVEVQWEIFNQFGPPTVDGLGAQGALWDIRVFAESMGPGPEILIGSDTLATGNHGACTVNQADPDCRRYRVRVNVPANTLPEDVGGRSGLYKLVASVFLNDATGRFDLSGYREGPVIRVESPRGAAG